MERRPPNDPTATVLPFPPARGREMVRFDRQELSAILKVYGRQVAAGEWRDYAIDFGTERAVFSIFRQSGEAPLFRVEKDPSRASRQGAYAVIAAGGLVLKRGHALDRVMRVLDRPPRIVG